MYKTSNILWGIVLISLGTIIGLNTLKITNINIFFKGWWTLFIIIPCFIELFNKKNKTGNITGLLIGIFLLLGCNNIINFNLVWKLIVPVSLIIVGLSFIFKDNINGKIKKEMRKLNKDNKKTYYAIFGGQDLNFSKEEFNGCNITAIFGGAEYNLQNTKIEKDVIINANAIFGGITILVPDNVNIKIISTPIFGGISDTRKINNNQKERKDTLYINALSIFGGIDIK